MGEPAKTREKLNVMIDFRRAAAEIKPFVTIKINFTTHFGPHAAEIEPIVKLIVNTKRTNIFLFILAINFTIRSISAAVGPKWVVKLTVKLIL